jgi:hypothetical protein
MTKLSLIAAAAMLLAAPTFSTVASAEPAAGVKVAEVVVVRHDSDWRHRHHHHCRSVTTWHHGHRVTVRRCD